jgi:glycosyltransferase involved in cell wall biosynthesis
MKVCLVNSFYPPYIGGAETYVSNLARNLVALGHEITVYCGDRPLAAGALYDGEVKVVRMRVPLSFYGTPLARFPASFATGDFDIIHCNFPNPYFTVISAAASRLEGVPAVLTWHNDLPAVTRAAATLVSINNIASVAYLTPYSKIIVTTNIYAKNSKMLRRERRKVEVIPNGVDTKTFNPQVECEWVKEKYHLKGYKTLIFVGALTTWHTYKGLDVLLKAFSLVRKDCDMLKLLIVGGGNLLDHYQRLAQETGADDRVVFSGRVGDGALPACYAASDFAVLPSRDSSEGFGLALLEAMACGKAVIGSGVGGIPEVIEDWKNGILVKPRDPEALANAIHALYMDDEVREKMGVAGREFAESRDWNIIAQKVSSLYHKVH